MTRSLFLIALLALPARAAELPSDLKAVPPDASVVVSFRASELVESAPAKLVLSAPGLIEAGPLLAPLLLPPADLERATFVQTQRRSPLCIVRAKKPFDPALLKKGRVEKEIGGKTFLFVDERGYPAWGAAFIIDERTFALAHGHAESIAGYFKDPAPGEHPLADGLAAAAGKRMATVLLQPSLLARQMAADNHPGKAPGKLPSLEEALDRLEKRGMMALPIPSLLRCERLMVQADLGDTLAADASARFPSEEAATDAATVARAALVLGRDALASMFRKADAKELETFHASVQKALKAAKVEQAGKTATTSLKVAYDGKGLATYVAERVPLLTQSNNLKQIGIAIHHHHDTFNRLPGDFVDKDGKKLLSWRVHLLPFIEQEALYRQFKFDEPWDSEHNKKLLDKMPKVFARVKGKAEKGMTHLQTFTGPGTVWNGRRRSPAFANIVDGLSNTIAVAEASKAVPWTKPEDMEVTEKALPKMGGQFPKVFYALFFDSTVRAIRNDFDEKAMRLAIDPADRMPLDLDEIISK
ncbi:MAG: DUF1559 domain-containing protein [Gemmataceae bacterium]|nr:DUF1559 domain-containing protein [Gemmataceae bacterium]